MKPFQPQRHAVDTPGSQVCAPDGSPMPTKQLIIIIALVALLSAGLGVVITSRMAPKEVKVSLDIGGGKSLDLAEMAERLGTAELRANEAAAIATLRSIASAQAQAQASAVIDTDGDTGGEYAYLSELAGSKPLRVAGEIGKEPLYPMLLSSAFGKVSQAGCIERSGYHFRVYLPGATFGGRTPGLPEGSATQPDGNNAEILWCAYAWPIRAGSTGARAFFMNQEGDLLATPNADGAYSGEDRAPAFDAALSAEYPGDMASITPLASLRQTSNDGRVWSSIGH